MARSTFEGPILSGDNRFGPQRDVGYTDLVQTAFLDFSVTSANTSNYGGASGVFVASNNIPNSKATIWTPQAGSYSATGPTAASAPTADATTLVYRGVSFLIPQGSNINDIFIDVGTIPKDTAGTPLAVTAIQPYVSNNLQHLQVYMQHLLTSLAQQHKDTMQHLLVHNYLMLTLHYKMYKTYNLVHNLHGSHKL